MKINKTIKKILSSFFLLFFLIIIIYPITVEARGFFESTKNPLIFKPQISIPGLWTAGEEKVLAKNDTSYIAQMVQGFYNYGIGIAGILATIILMAGGLVWLTSAGSSEKITQAKNLIGGSIIGLVILFGSWMLLRTINPNLVDFKITTINEIKKMEIATCCQYQDALNESIAKEGMTKKDCEDVNGKFNEISKAVVRENGKKVCAQSGCCICKIGGKWDTAFAIIQTDCSDGSNITKHNPNSCKIMCEATSAAFALTRPAPLMGVKPGYEYSFKWDYRCDKKTCIPNQGGGGGDW